MKKKKTIVDYRDNLQQMEQLHTFSKLYGGKIVLDEKTITTQELQDWILELKIEIAIKESNE